VKRIVSAPFLLLLAVYRRVISPAFPRRCRYEPTCSAYAEQAIRELGPVRGIILAAWRLLRCNPLSHGGIDDVANRRIFRDKHSHGNEVHA
jgi:hypothetical protein